MPFIPDFLAPQTSMVRTASGEYLPEDDNRALRPEEREALVAFHGAKEKHHTETGAANGQDQEYATVHFSAAAAHAIANPNSRPDSRQRGLQEQKQATTAAIDASSMVDAMKPRTKAPSPDWITGLTAGTPGSQTGE